jgi:tRNA U55 pseudouridine synthase TruB
MFSAKKMQGVRLYELARQNINVRRESIPVQLYNMKLLTYEPPYLQFEVHCSKGTYIRSLADELGRRLGTVAHLAELRRLSCGEFSIDESISLEDLRLALPTHLNRGYQNYVRLLRNEGLLRPRFAESPRTRVAMQGQGQDRHLQMNFKNGNSLLN